MKIDISQDASDNLYTELKHYFTDNPSLTTLQIIVLFSQDISQVLADQWTGSSERCKTRLKDFLFDFASSNIVNIYWDLYKANHPTHVQGNRLQ